MKTADSPPYGLLAEFETPAALVRAMAKLRDDGYCRIEGYTPFPVPGSAEALRFRPWGVPAIFLSAAIFGGAAGYFMQWYAAVVSYPLNIGGRPLHSGPSFIPITFESSILAGVLIGALSMLLLNRLPRYHHPVANVERFRAATSDGFFLCVEADDPKFDADRTTALLRDLSALDVTEIPRT